MRSLRELWHWWQTHDLPEHRITKAEAVESVRRYAEEHGLLFRDPIQIQLERRLIDPANRKAGFRYVYVMALGTWIPMPFVEVDITDGTVVAWRSLPR